MTLRKQVFCVKDLSARLVCRLFRGTRMYSCLLGCHLPSCLTLGTNKTMSCFHMNYRHINANVVNGTSYLNYNSYCFSDLRFYFKMVEACQSLLSFLAEINISPKINIGCITKNLICIALIQLLLLLHRMNWLSTTIFSVIEKARNWLSWECLSGNTEIL